MFSNPSVLPSQFAAIDSVRPGLSPSVLSPSYPSPNPPPSQLFDEIRRLRLRILTTRGSQDVDDSDWTTTPADSDLDTVRRIGEERPPRRAEDSHSTLRTHRDKTCTNVTSNTRKTPSPGNLVQTIRLPETSPKIMRLPINSGILVSNKRAKGEDLAHETATDHADISHCRCSICAFHVTRLIVYHSNFMYPFFPCLPFAQFV